MAIRTNSGDSFGVPSGYAGTNIPTDYFLPSCGIEDADKAVVNLFDKEIQFQVDSGQSETKKVPVVFAAGEVWASLKKGKMIRDKQGTLILPLIAIHRKTIRQSFDKDITGRGINQQTGELIIKRRLHRSDRSYQNLINKHNISNQDNVSTTKYELTSNANLEGEDNSGEWLAPEHKDNIWEIITIPSPQFYTGIYEITVWAQYMQHMNDIIQKIISSFLPQDSAFRLETPKGYWFMAYVEDNNFEVEDNFEDYSEEERYIKCKFSLRVEAYIVGSATSGTPAPVRRFISAPMISFSIGSDQEISVPSGSEEDTKIYDDPTTGFTLDGSAVPRADLKSPDIKIKEITKNPFTGKEKVKFVTVQSQNKKVGESVLRPYLIDNGLTYKIGG